MSQLEQQITQYRKMATDDPENELGHFRLGKALMDNHQFEEATRSFRRTLELSPQFSKVYQLLGTCLAKSNRQEDAIEVLNEGFEVADERGDTVPRDEMSKLLVNWASRPRCRSAAQRLAARARQRATVSVASVLAARPGHTHGDCQNRP